MYRTVLFTMTAAIALAGCTSIAKETRLSTRLTASEFNSLSSTYEERPTFVSLQTYSSGVVALVVDMDEYGLGKGAQVGYDMPNDYVIPFDTARIDAYLPLFDKYAEWAELARSRGDMIDREIGSAPGAGYQTAGEIKFSLHSGNAASQYLVLELCIIGVCQNQMHFTPENARELRALLVKARDGQLEHLDTSAIYK
jgi:hypothetical protein